jgi:hypothetical protein
MFGPLLDVLSEAMMDGGRAGAVAGVEIVEVVVGEGGRRTGEIEV